MPILEGGKVAKNFGGLKAVDNVDFQIEQGEIVGLIGPNGAGKTTLFNLISGAAALNAGNILFKSERINGLKPCRICRMGVARTFQSVKVFTNLSVFDNVLIGALFGCSGEMHHTHGVKKAEELIEFVGMHEKKNTAVKELTLANQKRIEVARALATNPELLLVDELMAGLNPAEVSRAMELVARIRDKGITIFMVEHVMRAIMNICDRIMVLHHGEKIAEGTPEEIASSRRVIEVYLGE